MDKPQVLGVAAPADFPASEYEGVESRIAFIPYGGELAWRRAPVEMLRSGWFAVGFRYLALDRWDGEWRESALTEHGRPPPDVRAQQEAALFGFFAAGTAVVDATAFAIAAAQGIAIGDRNTASERSQSSVRIDRVIDSLRQVDDGGPLGDALESLAAATAEMRRLRNILSHRTAPPRHFFEVPGKPHREVEWMLDIHDLRPEPIDSNTTSRHRRSLGPELSAVFTEFAGFIKRRWAAPWDTPNE